MMLTLSVMATASITRRNTSHRGLSEDFFSGLDGYSLFAEIPQQSYCVFFSFIVIKYT